MRETVVEVEQLTPVQSQIVQELYGALERLGADSSLLAVVGSWGDTLPEEEVLELLGAHNRSPRAGRGDLDRSTPGDRGTGPHRLPGAGRA